MCMKYLRKNRSLGRSLIFTVCSSLSPLGIGCHWLLMTAIWLVAISMIPRTAKWRWIGDDKPFNIYDRFSFGSFVVVDVVDDGVCVVPFDRSELQIGMDLVRISYFIGFDCCPSNAIYPNCENRILRFFSSQFIFIMCTSIRSIDVLLLLHQRQYEHSTLHSLCTRRVRAWTICCGRGNRTRIMRQNSV